MLAADPIQKVVSVHPTHQFLNWMLGSIPSRGEERDAHIYCQHHHEASRGLWHCDLIWVEHGTNMACLKSKLLTNIEILSSAVACLRDDPLA